MHKMMKLPFIGRALAPGEKNTLEMMSFKGAVKTNRSLFFRTTK